MASEPRRAGYEVTSGRNLSLVVALLFVDPQGLEAVVIDAATGQTNAEFAYRVTAITARTPNYR